jgi:hypothetical protein
MQLGDFGFFVFTIRKKTRLGEYITPMSGHYEIKEMDKRNVLLSDGDKELIVTMHRITKFEKKVKPKQ